LTHREGERGNRGEYSHKAELKIPLQYDLKYARNWLYKL
jgi:hypothetical protein